MADQASKTDMNQVAKDFVEKNPKAARAGLIQAKEMYIAKVNVLFGASQKASMPAVDHKQCQSAAEEIGKLIASHFDLALNQFDARVVDKNEDS